MERGERKADEKVRRGGGEVRKDVPPHSQNSAGSAFRPARCSFRTLSRFSRAPEWSGAMTSHSGSGALFEAIVRTTSLGVALRVMDVRFNGENGREEAKRGRRRACI